MADYRVTGPVNCDVDFGTSNLVGKTAVVTGGARGIGEAYVRALIAAGCFVCVGDIDVVGSENLISEFTDRIAIVQCDTTSWDDQAHLFSKAADLSPTGKIHYVVANAGIWRPDDVFKFESEPQKPDLKVIDVNVIGSLYTCKLAQHYFVKQNGQTQSPQQDDTCLVLIGSGASFLDCLRGPQYECSKWAMRGIMHCLRRTAYHYGSRVNVIAPWYVKTNILSTEAFDTVRQQGVEFATTEDAGQCLLRILSDASINGHSIFVSARKWAPRGYVDLDIDDYAPGSLLEEIQVDQLKGGEAERGLFV